MNFVLYDITVCVMFVIITLLQLVIFRVLKGPFYEDFHQCVTHGFYTEEWQEQLYGALSLMLMFVLPLLVLITTYVSTVFTIAREYYSVNHVVM